MKTRKEVLDYGLSFSDTYQNKEHWNTVILDGTVPADEIVNCKTYMLCKFHIQYKQFM